MAKSRVEKNKKLYEALDEEVKNSKGNSYEEKLKTIDPNISNGADNEDSFVVEEKQVKKNEVKSSGVLNAIAKEVKGENKKKNEVVVVKEKKLIKKEEVEMKEEFFEDPISFTDKLSVEEILRAKIEQQQKIKNSKRGIKKGPNDETYTPEMMQERIKQHEGVDVRREVKIHTKNYRTLAISLLTLALFAVIVIGILLVFKIIKL